MVLREHYNEWKQLVACNDILDQPLKEKFNKRILSIFILLLLTARLTVNAQVTFEKTFSDSIGGHCIAIQTSDNGYLLGLSDDNIHTHNWLIKTDSNGDTVWTKIYPEIGPIKSMVQTTDGGFILGTSMDCVRPLLIKTDIAGNITWAKRWNTTLPWGCNEIQDLQATPDHGSIFITNDMTSARLIKTDSLGNTLWQKNYDPIDSIEFIMTSIDLTNDGNYIMAGFSWYFTPTFDVYEDIIVLKLDTNGNILWTKSFPNQYDTSPDIVVCADDGYLIVSSSRDQTYNGGLLIKIDASGNIIWESVSGSHFWYAATETSSGYAVTGSSFLHQSLPVMMCDINTGNLIWSKKYSSTSSIAPYAAGYSISENTNGGIFIGSQGMAYFIKTDVNGLTDCSEEDSIDYSICSLGYTSTILNESSTITASVTSVITSVPGFGIVNNLCEGPVFSIPNEKSGPSLLIYPQPTSEIFYIMGFNNDDIRTICILDGSGKVVVKTTEAKVNDGGIYVGNLATGIYFVIIETKESTFTQKLCIQH